MRFEKFYCVTRVLARIFDFLNFKKQIELRKRRRKIAIMNRNDFIETTAKMLLETELAGKASEGMIPNPLLIPVIIGRNVERAVEMFEEKKRNGYFDELNVMIK